MKGERNLSTRIKVPIAIVGLKDYLLKCGLENRFIHSYLFLVEVFVFKMWNTCLLCGNTKKREESNWKCKQLMDFGWFPHGHFEGFTELYMKEILLYEVHSYCERG